MGWLLILLLLALLFGGLGFMFKFLWIVAFVLFIAWLFGLAVGSGGDL